MTTPEQRRLRLAFIAAIATVVLWGVNFSVQKYAFSMITPGGFLFARYLLMPACAFVMLLAAGGGRLAPVSRADLFTLARLGFVGHFLHVGMVTFGIHWSSAFSSSLILACGPVSTLLILRWRKVETLTRSQVAGVAIACVGVLVFLSEKLASGQWLATGGDLFLLVAGTFFSLYTVEAKPLIQRLGPIPVMGWATMLGGIPLMLAAAPAAVNVPWGALPASLWVAVLWAVLVSAFLGWLVWGWANATMGIARTAPLQYLMPPVAGLVAWLVGGERYSMANLAGAAITLAGVAIAQFTSPAGRPEREAPARVD